MSDYSNQTDEEFQRQENSKYYHTMLLNEEAAKFTVKQLMYVMGISDTNFNCNDSVYTNNMLREIYFDVMKVND